MADISVHDNHIISYEVDCVRKTIRLRTEFPEERKYERTDIVFEGVLAYRIECDNFYNILFDIDDGTIEDVVERDRAGFEWGVQHCWPGSWNKGIAESIEFLESANGKAFFISASCGMTGWVVSESMRFEAMGSKQDT